MSSIKIIFATKNKGKIQEINQIMKDTCFNIISMEEAGIDLDIEETGDTFEQNAILKATAIMNLTNEIVLSDDSGLEVDYLNKEPGVYSSRYMGVDTPYTIKNQHILDLLKDVPDEKRTARFVSVIAAVFPNKKTLTTRATIEGIIAHKIAGDNGFGYDPIFFVPEFGITTAQMSIEQKNKISHRGKALRLMKDKLLNEVK